MNMREAAQALGLPYTTYVNYEKGTREPNSEVLIKLAAHYGVTVDYLIGRANDPLDHLLPEEGLNAKDTAPSLTPAGARIGYLYERADDRDKRLVDTILDPYDDGTLDAQLPVQEKVIPLFGTSAAAGPGEFDTGAAWEDYIVSADSPAEFAARVSGDSMEPTLHDGEIVLCKKQRPEIGDVAVVMVNGSLLVKQFITDGVNLYLRSLNRGRRDCDVDVWASGNDTVQCFGTVILSKRPPLVDQ
jgi:SOS-response transcriptional repressor LexA/DNA-binding XRE family transcriptional regulator